VRERLHNSETEATISVIKTVTKDLWEAEDHETKAIVAAVMAKAQDAPIEDNPERTPQQYQR
jgi:hypothetical protein